MQHYIETSFPDPDFDPFTDEDTSLYGSEDFRVNDGMLAVKVSGRQFERVTSLLQRLGIGYTVRHAGPTSVPKDPAKPFGEQREATSSERLALGSLVLTPAVGNG